MNIDNIAKQLANKVNQEHYIKHYLENVQRSAYEKGLKDAESKQSEQLKAFADWLQSDTANLNYDFRDLVDEYLKSL